MDSIQPVRTLLRGLADRLPPYTAGWLRIRLLRAGGLRIGRRSMVGGRLRLAGGPDPASRVRIGDDCFINDGCRFDTSAPITIEDGAYLGHDVAVLTSSHELGPPERRAGTFSCAPIQIGRGVWIGARAVLLPGVSIGDGAVVAAGAVVTHSVGANVVVGGVPAREVRTIGSAR
jgi:maltose O-acetyltransferase